MNERLLAIIEKEKPDYVLFDLGYDEFYLETFEKIKKISPGTKTIVQLGDDTWKFDDFSRYYALFFDFIFLSKKNYSEYKKDGINNVFHLEGTNLDIFKPKNLKKIYDVTFIGGTIRDRPDFIRFLLKNKVNVKLFGFGWSEYPDLRSIWGGVLNLNDYVKVVNQSKINLNFSKGFLKVNEDTQLKGRVFEILACKSFLLTEYFEGMEAGKIHNLFSSEDINKISFKTKEELLQKIKYYLKNEKEREKLTERFYKKVIQEYDCEYRLKESFREIIRLSKKSLPRTLPEINNKVIYLSRNDLNLGLKKIKEKIKDYDKLCFKEGKSENLSYRDYLQSYSLEKSKKPISCCDYYVHSKSLGDYMLFMSKRAFKNLGRDDFSKLLDVNQLMVKKNYFLKNFKEFKNILYKKKIDFIDKKNTVFVSIPLIRIKNLNLKDYNVLKEAFRMKFLDNLFSVFYQKKALDSYPYKLFAFGLFKKRFIIKHIFLSLKNTVNWENLKEFLNFEK